MQSIDAARPAIVRSGAGAWLMLVALMLAAGNAFAMRLDVKVTGLAGEQETNVLALLSIYQERAEADLTPARVEALHRLAPDQIRDALAPFGLYQVEVTDRLEVPPDPNGTWVATYAVVPGSAVKIGRVDYAVIGEGADDPAFPKTFPMQVGDVLLHAKYEAAKSDLRSRASSGGYLDYNLARNRVLVDMVAYEAIVEFELDTGPRYYLGKVSFKQDLLNDKFLRSFLNFEPGVVYDPNLLLALQGRLLGTEYFSDVEIVPRKDATGDDTLVPIEVVATRNKRDKYRIGAGFTTDTGPRVSADWRRRYVNQWGHNFRTELQLSPVLSQWSFDYRIPIQDPTRDYIIIKPQSTWSNINTQKGWLNSVQVAHSTLTPSNWRRTVGIDYTYEDYEISDIQTGTSSELAPNISWSKTVADDPINTKRGYRIRYGVLGAVEGLISNASYLSAALQLKWIHGFADKYRFITRADLGVTLAEDLTELPASRRFFTGGDNTIRGWGYNALGPTEPFNDETVGGRYLGVGSLELERTIRGPWSAAVFTDFGNAFDPDYENKFQQSVGFGVRWASPIGQVRVDLALPFTQNDYEIGDGWPPARLVFVIGPDL
ncbi:autotransporter assembly complex family protein [Thiocapsa sp.]|uniref:autotransporter assembly complex protein TamA n=1 Tax=Thiocapsa sp. TaxID=2024551 RepID=UPI002CDB0632|nr:autotransporter assembly complex family protein [Thiocapsa sp.]HSO81896.1 autotransporter assembly complex family protein [Thiocapsa sp.]